MSLDFSLSTSWISWRVPDIDEMIDEIKSFGFSSVELDFTLSTKKVKQIKNLVKQDKIKVTSLHNFCPFPDDYQGRYKSPNIYNFASKDPLERELAVKNTCRTIDYALELGAKAIVTHCGEFPVKNHTNKLIDMLEQNQKDSTKYSKLKLKLFRELEPLRQEFLQYTLFTLDKINEYAVKKGIMVGIENRYLAHEIPDIEGAVLLLNQLQGGNIRYWHDVGHAQMMENLDIFYHEEYVNFFKNHIVGIHIHDIIRSSDHRAPGTGIFDFNRINEFLNQDIIKVLEVHHPTSPSELKNGVLQLDKLLKEGTE